LARRECQRCANGIRFPARHASNIGCHCGQKEFPCALPRAPDQCPPKRSARLGARACSACGTKYWGPPSEIGITPENQGAADSNREPAVGGAASILRATTAARLLSATIPTRRASRPLLVASSAENRGKNQRVNSRGHGWARRDRNTRLRISHTIAILVPDTNNCPH